MSNRRKLPGGGGGVPASVLRKSACPDCNSDVLVKDGGARVEVWHDTGCPALASLERQGRTTQLALYGDPEDLAEAAATVVAEVEGIRVADHPYTDLDLGRSE